MATYLRITLFCLGCFVLISSCKRRGEPFPRICTSAQIVLGDEVTIHLGDTLTLVNCSDRYQTQKWIFPNGGTSTQESVYFVPPSTGNFSIRLLVSDDDFANDYEASTNIVVIP